MREAIKILVGSVLVYLGVAACGAATRDKHGSPSDAGAGGTTAALGGASASSGSESIGGANGPSLLDPIPQANAQVSGTRLRAIQYVTPDGARQFVAWQDITRNERCTFTETSSGVRCMPAISASAQYYYDDQCTDPVFLIQGENQLCGKDKPVRAPKIYGLATTQAGGCTTTDYYGLDVNPAAPGSMYALSANGCAAIAAPTLVGTYYRGTKLDLNDFVLATEKLQQ